MFCIHRALNDLRSKVTRSPTYLCITDVKELVSIFKNKIHISWEDSVNLHTSTFENDSTLAENVSYSHQNDHEIQLH